MSDQITNAINAGARWSSTVGAKAIAMAILGLAVAAPATVAAQQAKPAASAKHTRSKPALKQAASNRAVVAPVASATAMETWHCELGNSFQLGGNLDRDVILAVNWQGRVYKLPRQETTTGAERYFDAASGIDLVIIPSKAMLFNRRAGQRLADQCMTTAMRAGESAHTRAEALRAPVVDPLMPQAETGSQGSDPTRRQ